MEDFHVMFRGALNDILKRISIPNHAVKIRILGNKSFLESDVQADFERLERTSSQYTATKILNVCFAYTARDEIRHSVRTIASIREEGAISKGEISERMITQNLYVSGSGQPVDILVRTSGHQRLSDFLLWQCSSDCKVVFIDVLWPNFKTTRLLMIIFNWSFEQATAFHRYRLFVDSNSRMPVNVHTLPPSPAFAVVSKASTNK